MGSGSGRKVVPQGTGSEQQSCLPPLVFIHGAKGSHLRAIGSSSCRVYPKLGSILCPRCWSDQFQLPLNWVDSDDGLRVQALDCLVSDGPISHVEVCCGFLSLAEYYKPFIDWASAAKRELHTFHYDWRRELDEASSALEFFLENVTRSCSSANESGRMGAQVVCHSMGAMIAFALLNRRPELFHSVLLAAPAVMGGCIFLEDLSIPGAGNTVGGWNTTMMTPRHWLSWPSGYHALPLPGDPGYEGRPHLAEADGETEVAADFYDIEDWRRLRLGPYHPRSGVLMEAGAEAFLCETLRRARAFRAQIVYDPLVEYPPIVVLKSDAVKKTATTYLRPSSDAPFEFSSGKLSPRYTPGDGRIWAYGPSLPVGVPVLETRITKSSHTHILSDLGHVRELVDLLLEAAKRRGKNCGSTRRTVSHVLSALSTDTCCRWCSSPRSPASAVTQSQSCEEVEGYLRQEELT